MPKVQKLIPINEFRKPLFKPQGDDIWIIERLEQTKKAAERELAAKKEALIDELHMPGLSRQDAKAIKATMSGLHEESEKVRLLNKLLRAQKVQAYEEQVKHSKF